MVRLLLYSLPFSPCVQVITEAKINLSIDQYDRVIPPKGKIEKNVSPLDAVTDHSIPPESSVGFWMIIRL